MDLFASTAPDEAKIKIACIQMQPAIGNVEANVAHSIELIDRAVGLGATLVVLPELCNTGYMFRSREEAFAASEPVPAGPTVHAWSEIAAQHGLHLVAGICERDGAKLYNSAVADRARTAISARSGRFISGTRRTCFRARRSRLSRVPHADRPHRRWRFATTAGFPRRFRLCALQGADIVCVPTNWVPIPGQAEGREAMANILAMAAAHSNSIYIACADRVGVERGQPFEGQSLIVSFTGWPVAGPASRDRGGNPDRRGRSRRGPASTQLERLQPGSARSPRRRL